MDVYDEKMFYSLERCNNLKFGARIKFKGKIGQK